MTVENLYLNTKRLAAEQGKKLWAIEKAAGLSTGYLSRKKSCLSIVAAAKIAESLGTTVDDLLADPPVQRNIDILRKKIPEWSYLWDLLETTGDSKVLEYIYSPHDGQQGV